VSYVGIDRSNSVWETYSSEWLKEFEAAQKQVERSVNEARYAPSPVLNVVREASTHVAGVMVGWTQGSGRVTVKSHLVQGSSLTVAETKHLIKALELAVTEAEKK
jgi:hypothetical protein